MHVTHVRFYIDLNEGKDLQGVVLDFVSISPESFQPNCVALLINPLEHVVNGCLKCQEVPGQPSILFKAS